MTRSGLSCSALFAVVLASVFLDSSWLYAQSAGDFSVVVLPDTQNYSQFYPQIFDAQTQWVANNGAQQNIQLVIGVGDVANSGIDTAQTNAANHSINILDQAGIPYVFAIGNHDYNSLPPTTRVATAFNQYLGPSRYASKAYYGASNFPAGSNENFYATFTWGGKNYLILVLEFVPRDSALAWARSVLNANPDKEVIVVTHSYLYSDSTTVDECDTSDMVGDNDGSMQWAKLISQYPNISVVLSGHVTNKFTARRDDIGVNGNFVHQIFANWQDWTNGGNGYLRIMKFSPANNSISVQTYSPYTGLFLTDAGDQFSLKWHNDGTAGSGTAIVTGRVRTASYGAGCKVVPDATVNVGGGVVATDSNGNYTISLPPGQVAATASADGYQTAQTSATLNDYFPNNVNFFLFPTAPCDQSSTDPSLTICQPLNNSNVTSPVKVVAGFNSSSPINGFTIWLDGKSVASIPGVVLNTNVTMTPGSHQLIVQASNGRKQVFSQSVTLTVASASTCQPSAAVPSINICTPANGATVSSPFNVQAAAHMVHAIHNSQIWLDGKKVFEIGAANVNTSITGAAGSHRVTLQSTDSAGVIVKQTITVTVRSGSPASCPLSTTNPSVTICNPANNASIASPVNVVAGTTDTASAVINTFVWLDGVKVLTSPGGSLNTSMAMTAGAHRLTVQAKDASGRFFQPTANITVH